MNIFTSEFDSWRQITKTIFLKLHFNFLYWTLFILQGRFLPTKKAVERLVSFVA